MVSSESSDEVEHLNTQEETGIEKHIIIRKIKHLSKLISLILDKEIEFKEKGYTLEKIISFLKEGENTDIEALKNILGGDETNESGTIVRNSMGRQSLIVVNEVINQIVKNLEGDKITGAYVKIIYSHLDNSGILLSSISPDLYGLEENLNLQSNKSLQRKVAPLVLYYLELDENKKIKEDLETEIRMSAQDFYNGFIIGTIEKGPKEVENFIDINSFSITDAEDIVNILHTLADNISNRQIHFYTSYFINDLFSNIITSLFVVNVRYKVEVLKRKRSEK